MAQYFIMELSSVQQDRNEVNSEDDARFSQHSLRVNVDSTNTTQSLPNLSDRRPQHIQSVRLPPIEHHRGRTNIIQVSQTNSERINNINQMFEFEEVYLGNEEQNRSLSNRRELIQ